jgi:hypothetical protein
LYTVTLQINGNTSLQRVKTSYIHVLPDEGIPYSPAAGGNFDINPLDFGAENISGTPFERGSSSIAAKSGTFSGSNAWVTGLTATNYLNNTDARLWTPNYNFSAPGTYTLKFYRKNSFEIGWDGFRVEYSLDKGDNWTLLGSAVAANWYDFANTAGATAFPVNQPYFNQTRSSFTLCQYNVSALAGNPNVAFRLRFKSDGAVTAPGLAIDDFEIIGPVNSPLPVELAEFSGEAKENFNALKWITTSEINNNYFDLERSANGMEFQTVVTIKGNGTTTNSNSYSHDDFDIEPKNYYYRLKQVDYNGNSKYSSVILVKRHSNASANIKSVFPNPFTQQLILIFNSAVSEPVEVSLFNLTGKQVYHERMVPQGVICTIDLAKNPIASGAYLLKATCGNETRTFKVFRQ